MKYVAVIPAYNPGVSVKKAVEATLIHTEAVILVDDGSDGENKVFFEEWENHKRVFIVKHEKNLGKGHALFSGFKEALNLSFDYLVTLDSDGQHNPEEIRSFKDFLEKGEKADLVVGERNFSLMPWKSRIGNVFTAKIFGMFFGNEVSDTQSGFRVISREFIEDILKEVNPGRYETEMNILTRAFQSGRKVGGVKIETIYIEKNKNSKFNPVADSISVLGRFVKFSLFSFSAFILDYSIYTVLNFFGGIYFIQANVISKTVAVIYYFFVNKYVVFYSRGNTVFEAGRYVFLVAINIFTTSVFLYLLVQEGDWSKYFAKPAADAIMFLINFLLMGKFVYKVK
ncbi:MAG: hypothetical protein A2430_02065 [Candidatus Liptonbacteria bacterium RIFOXYC1_FULL_36_8]|uniref:GtrA-like protein domain-containing protein n=3 Tax=Candidatus Liptoniibacteriota TaxID=1817909 RepID=A0A1G2CM27_9BACT|nr:MAG: hypothetical protein A2390_02795 [Candidatus Liptonbacteria bacterium RIFOXYB1_FULL_36_10]OGZ03515.1 MAG: hypothetical protein A2430_02065 [Candidatus Liptonbacteria bacterium RIFOXYC1_FULL_36_8]